MRIHCRPSAKMGTLGVSMALRYWAIRGDVAHFTSAVYTGAFCGRVSPTGATETWSMRRPCRTKSWLEDR